MKILLLLAFAGLGSAVEVGLNATVNLNGTPVPVPYNDEIKKCAEQVHLSYKIDDVAKEFENGLRPLAINCTDGPPCAALIRKYYNDTINDRLRQFAGTQGFLQECLPVKVLEDKFYANLFNDCFSKAETRVQETLRNATEVAANGVVKCKNQIKCVLRGVKLSEKINRNIHGSLGIVKFDLNNCLGIRYNKNGY